MKTTLKCSNCGAEVSNLSMSWQWKKQWPWLLLMLVPLVIGVFVLPDFDKRANPDDFAFQGVTISETDEAVIVRGTLLNNGNQDWGSLTLEIEFFDQEGRFLDELSEYLSAGMKARTQEHFKITGSKKYTEISGFRDFKVRVVDGRAF